MAEWAFCVRVIGETAVDSGNNLKFNLHGYDGQALPAPKVYVNGVLKTSPTDYTFSNGSASVHCFITFTGSQAGKTVTCDYRWKYTCTDQEAATAYEAGKDENVTVNKDINGRNLISVAYTPADSFKGMIAFEYMSRAFYDEWALIAENAYFFDLIRTSDAADPKTISNLLCTSYPRMVDIPGVPDLIGVSVEFIQAA